jgi:hypothetical protein
VGNKRHPGNTHEHDSSLGPTKDRPGEAREVEGIEQRRARRLADDLGINAAGIQVVLRLRRQVVTLQGLIRQLEAALRIERARSSTRLERYRREYHEAKWEDTL